MRPIKHGDAVGCFDADLVDRLRSGICFLNLAPRDDENAANIGGGDQRDVAFNAQA